MKIKRMENKVFNFLNQSVRHFKEIGSITPDSNTCINSLVNPIPFDSAELILEYGAGSGAVTGEILKRKEPGSTLISFEKNKIFYNRLKKNLKGKNIFIVNDDVFNSRNTLLLRFGVQGGSVDCIISTLPWSSLKFEELLMNEVLPLLKDGGIFIQYMHTLSVFKGILLRPILKRHFSKIDLDFVFFNIPPALVYTCRVHVKR
ncbi:MAG TPA: rRNA adenine N-6-methyltransferase family protein [Ignavibacteriaceae bacterium]|nr:rRNA adenine N-6-methyltransferase family protein [Ignavibacteriaceae bacterium]